jgi:hypothetical protein
MHRAQTFRLSLLVSLGLSPAACGGSTSATDGDGSTAGGGSAGNAGTTNQAGAAGASMGGSMNRPACTSPTTDPITGLVTCKEGYQHRPQAVACGVTIQKAAPPGGSSGIGAPEPMLPRAGGDVSCSATPETCDAYQYGYCDMEGGGAAPAVCRSGCITDDECGEGRFCACGYEKSPTTGICQAALCRTNSDCGDYRCAIHSTPCSGPQLACHSAIDECWSDADCEPDALCMPGAMADTVIEHGRRCTFTACGRPFLVREAPRVAAIVANRAWRDPAQPRVEHLSEAERGEHAAHWARLGQLEHASIAAFARFSLHLLSLGAPPELVDASTRAIADETAHTRLCFGLASAYAGRDIGPGPLDVSSSLEAASLGDIVDLVLREGCIGETRAALEALELADRAEDPVIRAAYARIAGDEQRHAELAFHFVRWALEQGAGVVRERIDALLVSSAVEHPIAQLVTKPCLEALRLA